VKTLVFSPKSANASDLNGVPALRTHRYSIMTRTRETINKIRVLEDNISKIGKEKT
jgi:hypothetical protein